MENKSGLLELRNSLVADLTQEYNNQLLLGKREEIIQIYEGVNQGLPSVESRQSIAYSVILNCAKSSLERCRPLVEKLKEKELSLVEKVLLSNELASAVVGCWIRDFSK